MEKRFKIYEKVATNVGFSTEKETDPRIEFETDCREEAIAYFEKLKNDYLKDGYKLNPSSQDFSDYYNLSNGKHAEEKIFELCEYDENGDFIETDTNQIFSVANFFIHPIDQLLLENKMSRYQLAKVSGLNESTLSNIVNRKTKVDDITVGTLVKIANGLNFDLEETYCRLKSYE